MLRALFVGACLWPALVAQSALTGTLVTIDGRSMTGAFSVDAEGRAHLVSAAGTVDLSLGEVLTFAPQGAVVAAPTTPHRVWLRSGVELPAVRLAGKPGAPGKPAMLVVELPVGATVELPLGSLHGVRHGGVERPEPSSLGSDLSDPPANNDLIYVVKDGKATRSSVTVVGLQADKVDFELRGKAYDFDLAGVTALVFGKNTGFAADRQSKPRASLDLVTGEHLEGRLLLLGEVTRLRLDEGAEVEFPSNRVFHLAIASDRLRWLSDLIPTVEQTPAFDRVWPWTNDRSIGGPGFLVGGVTYTRGVGMVPRTRLTYDLGGNYDVFDAMIGIDDRGGPQAHAVFRVLADDKIVFEAGDRTRGLPPMPVHIELEKCRRLAIEVDFGKNYDLGDYCAFADARVVRR
jgi:hypothetical protein